MDRIAKFWFISFYSYGHIRQEICFWKKVMLTIEHRDPHNRRMCGSLEHWQVWWHSSRWFGWIWIHSLCFTIEWCIPSSPHIDAYYGSLFH